MRTVALTGQVDPELTAAGVAGNTASITHSAEISPADNVSIATLALSPPEAGVGDAGVVEGDGGQSYMTFTAVLSPANPYATGAVDYATSDGSADAGSDYAAAAGRLTFAPGQTTQTIAVLVNADRVVEGDETFTLTLSNPAGLRIAREMGVGRILNDDGRAPSASRVYLPLVRK
jgi:hypothetical protein